MIDRSRFPCSRRRSGRAFPRRGLPASAKRRTLDGPPSAMDNSKREDWRRA